MRLRPRLEDMGGWDGRAGAGGGEDVVIGGEGGAESVAGGCEGGSLRERWIDAGRPGGKTCVNASQAISTFAGAVVHFDGGACVDQALRRCSAALPRPPARPSGRAGPGEPRWHTRGPVSQRSRVSSPWAASIISGAIISSQSSPRCAGRTASPTKSMLGCGSQDLDRGRGARGRGVHGHGQERSGRGGAGGREHRGRHTRDRDRLGTHPRVASRPTRS